MRAVMDTRGNPFEEDSAGFPDPEFP
jgi:hypothetical protein